MTGEQRTPGSEGSGTSPRGSLRLVRDPVFGPYVAGRLLSSAGIWIHNIVAALLAFELTGSAFVVGLVSVAQFLPQLALAPLTGAMADRGNRKAQVIAGRCVVATASGAMALWLMITDLGATADATALVLSALLSGVGFVTGGPAMQAMIPSLVRRDELVPAITLSTVPPTLARAGGPALGAAIALTLGPVAAFVTAAVCNLAFAVLLVAMHVPAHTRAPRGKGSVWGGFVYLRSDRVTARLLIGVAAIGVGADPAITLAPSLSAATGHGSSYAGALASAFGVGTGLVFLAIPALRRVMGVPAYGALGLVLLAAGLLMLPLITTPASAMPALGVSGAGMTLSLTSLSAQLQERVPDELRGRVMALWSMAFLGSRPAAAAMNGAVADRFSVQAAVMVVALLVLAAAVTCRPSRLTAD